MVNTKDLKLGMLVAYIYQNGITDDLTKGVRRENSFLIIKGTDHINDKLTVDIWNKSQGSFAFMFRTSLALLFSEDQVNFLAKYNTIFPRSLFQEHIEKQRLDAKKIKNEKLKNKSSS